LTQLNIIEPIISDSPRQTSKEEFIWKVTEVDVMETEKCCLENNL